MENHEFEQLEKDLRLIGSFSLGKKKRKSIKAGLMMKINEEIRLIQSISAEDKKVSFDSMTKARIKENILEKICESFTWARFFGFYKKVLSTTLVIAVIFLGFAFINTESSIVSASPISYVNYFDGSVVVYRDGQPLALEAGVEIKEGDHIMTGEDGELEIYFFNDSKSRVAPNSHLTITGLGKNKFDEKVEIEIKGGRVWNKVVRDTEKNPSLIVNADETRIAVTKPASFDVLVDKGTTEVGVFNQSVEILANNKQEKVLSGEKFLVLNNITQITKISDEEKDVSWIKENIAIDHKYLTDVEKRLLKAKVQTAKDGTSTISFLTFNDVKEQKLKLEKAEKDLLSVQYKLRFEELNEAEKVKAEKVIEDFEKQVDGFYLLINEVEKTDPKYATELENFVSEKIQQQKSDLAVVLPDSPVYKVKEAVNEIEYKIANDKKDLLKIKLKQNKEKLFELEQIKSKGNKKLAETLFKEYKKSLKAFIDEFESIESPEVKEELMKEFSVDLKILKNINAGDISELDKILPKEVKVMPKAGNVEVIEKTIAPPVQEIIKEESIVEDEIKVEEGPFGVKIQGEKVLSPLL